MSTPQTPTPNDDHDPVAISKMSKDLRLMAAGMTPNQAQSLVKTYYRMQDQRMRVAKQASDLKKRKDQHDVLDWFTNNNTLLETQAKGALAVYSMSHPVGKWMRGITGIGPVLAAGLLSCIDITQCPTVGHIWRYAGQDATVRWWSKEKCAAWIEDHGGATDALITEAAEFFGRREETLRKFATTNADGEPVKLTTETLAAALARRPWNALLKVLCWKVGESFVKTSTNEADFYGHIYAQRKALEWKKNLNGEFADQCEKALASKNYSGDSNAKLWYTGKVDRQWAAEIVASGKDFPLTCKKSKGETWPMLPPAHIHSRAKRYAAKLFIAHLHEVWYKHHFKTAPPLPYPIAHLGHAHKIEPPNQQA